MCVDKETGKVTPKFKEMITSGKTGSMSATGFMGIISGIMALILILTLVVYFFCKPDQATVVLELVDKIIVIFSISAGLLGVRKISGVIGNAKFSAGEGSADYTERTEHTTKTSNYYRSSTNSQCIENE